MHLGPRTGPRLAALTAALIVAGCGGGGGGDSQDAKTSPTVITQDGQRLNSCAADPACSNANTSPAPTPTAPAAEAPASPSTEPVADAAVNPNRSTDAAPTTPKPPPLVQASVEQPGSNTPGTNNPDDVQSPAPVVSEDPLPPQPPAPPVASAPPVVQPVNRHTVDMPDEVQQGMQIHVIYAVPRGNTDRGLDLTDRFINSIGTANNWLRQQTGGTLEMNLDTYQGRLDITYVALPRTDAEYETHGALKLLPIQQDLRAAGQIRDNKLYYVYYDGDWSVSCGTAANVLNGDRVAVQFLRGLETRPGVNPCENNPKAQSPTDTFTYLDRVVLHELLHLIGIPHVGDSPTDLMYGYEYGTPSRPVQDSEFVLDFRQDSYAFDRSRGGFARGTPNIYDSPAFRRIIR